MTAKIDPNQKPLALTVCEDCDQPCHCWQREYGDGSHDHPCGCPQFAAGLVEFARILDYEFPDPPVAEGAA